VVIHNLDFVGISPLPAKANSPPNIDPDAVLALTITPQLLKAVRRRHTKILQSASIVQIPELPVGHLLNVDRQPV
jgi:hypothetical protein